MELSREVLGLGLGFEILGFKFGVLGLRFRFQGFGLRFSVYGAAGSHEGFGFVMVMLLLGIRGPRQASFRSRAFRNEGHRALC